jgi:hypothetical protein
MKDPAEVVGCAVSPLYSIFFIGQCLGVLIFAQGAGKVQRKLYDPFLEVEYHFASGSQSDPVLHGHY